MSLRNQGPHCSDDVCQVFFSNIQLLGFDAAAMSAKYSFPFNSTMFRLPNKKGYEVVMHFLFSKLNPTRSREEFRHCWPITGKKLEQDFNRAVTKWLTDISKEEADAKLPRIFPSVVLSPGGEKFMRLLFYFSTFVVKCTIKNELGLKDDEILKRPILTSNNAKLGSTMHKAVVCNVIRHRQQFLSTIKKSLVAQKQWKQFARDIVKEYRRLSKNIRELEHQIRDARQKLEERAVARGSSLLDDKAQSVKRAQAVQKVRSMWKELEKFVVDQSEEKEVIQSIFKSVTDQHQIDGREIDLKVPELLLRECEADIQRRQVENTFEGGKLNLLSLIQLWNLSLQLYIEKLREVGVPKLEVDPFRTLVHKQHTYVTLSQTMKNKLAVEVVPDLCSSIENLQSSLPGDIPQYSSPGNKSNNFQLSPTSPFMVSMSPDAEDRVTPPGMKTRVSPKEDLDTPETVKQLKHSVVMATRKAQPAPVIPAHKSDKEDVKRETNGSNKLALSKLPVRQKTKQPVQSKSRIPLNRAQSKNLQATSNKKSRVSGERTSPDGLHQTALDRVEVLKENVTPKKVAYAANLGSPRPGSHRNSAENSPIVRSAAFKMESPAAAKGLRELQLKEDLFTSSNRDENNSVIQSPVQDGKPKKRSTRAVDDFSSHILSTHSFPNNRVEASGDSYSSEHGVQESASLGILQKTSNPVAIQIGQGDEGVGYEEEEAFAPVKHGLEYTSPYRPKKDQNIENLIAKYEKLRKKGFNSDTSGKSAVGNTSPLEIHVASDQKSSPIVNKPGNSVAHDKQSLFSLDCEEFDQLWQATKPTVEEIDVCTDTVRPLNLHEMHQSPNTDVLSLKNEDLLLTDHTQSASYKSSPIKNTSFIDFREDFPPNVDLLTPDDFYNQQCDIQKELFTNEDDLLDLVDVEPNHVKYHSTEQMDSVKNQRSEQRKKSEKSHVRFSPASTGKSQLMSNKTRFALDIEDPNLDNFHIGNDFSREDFPPNVDLLTSDDLYNQQCDIQKELFTNEDDLLDLVDAKPNHVKYHSSEQMDSVPNQRSEQRKKSEKSHVRFSPAITGQSQLMSNKTRFALDIEDSNLNDFHIGNDVSTVTSNLPEGSNAGSSVLDSFLSADGSFLVATSPPPGFFSPV